MYSCTACAANFNEWRGQCSACGRWNTLVRLPGQNSDQTIRGYAGTTTDLTILDNVPVEDRPRLESGIGELDRVLGGGFMPGSAILIGGSPGAGKSTLLLQVLALLSGSGTKCVYVSGEESLQQIAARAKRLGLSTKRLLMLADTNMERVLDRLGKANARVVVIDSIQVMETDMNTSGPGTVSQVRDCATLLTRYAKKTDTIVILVGHITKDGALAGPKVLEHIIDCSLMLDASEDMRYRLLRSQKNRFGAINELGVFAMESGGMVEVENPSAIFLERDGESATGSVVTVIHDGRPMLVEIQALCDDSRLDMPRRVAVGPDQNRMPMLLAVLHRHGKLPLGKSDVFVNIAGGVQVRETSIDLAILLAVASSHRDKPFPIDTIVFGEVGLSGEVRPVAFAEDRLKEAAKHGFKQAIVAAGNKPKEKIPGMKVTAVKNLVSALKEFIGEQIQ